VSGKRPPRPDRRADAMVELFVAIADAFFKLRAFGQRVGAMTSWGGGSWGLMRSLALGGPQTVPQLARARPVARQRIQRIVDELAAAGLVELADNPHHRRSKLVRLTSRGEARYAEVTQRLREAAARLTVGLPPAEVETARRTLAALSARLRDG
jgi:DNA-binding MarR family transcriptional regulator